MKRCAALVLAAVLIVPFLFFGCKKKSMTADVGSWKDGVYTNAYTGVAFKLPEGWKALDNDALFEINGMSNANLAKDAAPDVEMLLQAISVATLMEADDPNGGGRVTLSLASLKGYRTGTTLQEYFETLKAELAESAKYTYVFDEDAAAVKLGKESYRMYTAEAFGVNDSNQIYSAFYRAFCLKKVDGRMAIVEIVAKSRDGIVSCLGYFL